MPWSVGLIVVSLADFRRIPRASVAFCRHETFASGPDGGVVAGSDGGGAAPSLVPGEAVAGPLSRAWAAAIGGRAAEGAG